MVKMPSSQLSGGTTARLQHSKGEAAVKLIDRWCKIPRIWKVVIPAYIVMALATAASVYTVFFQQPTPEWIALGGEGYAYPQKVISGHTIQPGGVMTVGAVEKCNFFSKPVETYSIRQWVRRDVDGLPPIYGNEGGALVQPGCVLEGPFSNHVPANLGPSGSVWEYQGIVTVTNPDTGQKNIRIWTTELVTVK